MSDESKSKEKTFEFPMMPVFDMGIGRELGSLDSRLARVENDVMEIKHDLKAIDAKFESKIDRLDDKTDKMGHAIHRLDERAKNLESKFNLSIGLTGAVLAAVIAGIIIQLFYK